MRPGDWTCPICNGHIYASKQFCCKCKVNKHGTKATTTDNCNDWNCRKCGDLQFANRTKCRQCNEPRFDMTTLHNVSNSRIRPGDWLCPKCGDHQFANNVTCRRCYTQNPNLSTQTITCVNNLTSITEPSNTETINDDCVVCMDNKKCMLLLHANGTEGHLCCCQHCAAVLISNGDCCPMCRSSVSQAIKVY